MRREKKWVYFCEHCDKSSRSGGAIGRHEKHCTKGPQRECRMCKRVGNEQVSISRMHVVISTAEQLSETAEQSEPFATINVTPLRDITNNCPACILSAIRQYEGGKRAFHGFDFKEEAKAWIEDYRAANLPINQNGDSVFDPAAWLHLRGKRAFSEIGVTARPHPANCTCDYCATPF